MAKQKSLATDVIRQLISDLEEQARNALRQKEHLEEVLRLQEGTVSGGRVAGRTSTNALGKTGRKRQGPTLRKAIVSVLSKATGPLKPGELRDRILASGYETKAKPASLYTAVYSTAAKEPGVKKTKAGFSLGAKLSREMKKKPGKKRGRKKGSAK